LANFLSQALVTYLKNIEIDNAETIGKLTNYAIIIFVFSLALTQLNIGKELISNAFLIVFSALCLALALAFGIGGKEWAAGVINKYFKN